MPTLTKAALQAALPDVTSSLTLPGLDGPVTIYRDTLGTPHVQATTTHDSFFGQGFAIAQDRLWQMDFDRMRAHGRSAEVLGASAVTMDTLVRRMGFQASAQADYETLSDHTRAMFDAYAEGVNAFIGSTKTLPIEYRLLDLTPNPWRALDSLSVAKIRHVFMGNFEYKLWRAKLLAKVGPEMVAKLFPSSEPGDLVIVPPGGEFEGEANDGREILSTSDDLTRWITDVFGNDGDSGSNSWALAGSRTATGKPLLAGDPHRPLDTPNVYIQNHVACPEFDVVGLSFAGVPSFFHFGHSQTVAWCVTHASADYQDLFIERFTTSDTYEFKGEPRKADVRHETINVRGGAPVEIDVVTTHHGPVIMGSPKSGIGLTLRYTATAEPSPWADSLFDMLVAKDVDEFEAAMRPWVDPCNTMMCADLDGNISFQVRGKLPLRSRENAWVPVPGWDGEHEWDGVVPFEEMPRVRNPENGFLVTANNRIMDASYPHYITMDKSPDHRARRVLARIKDMRHATVEDMASVHAERTSIVAQRLVPALVVLSPANDKVRQAIDLLKEWDCAMDRDQAAPTVYSATLSVLIRKVVTPMVGPTLTEAAMNGTDRGGPAHLNGLRGQIVKMVEQNDTSLLREGASWGPLLASALEEAIAWIVDTLGDDVDGWTWGVLHRTGHTHTLAGAVPEHAGLLNPPTVDCGGDADTPQAGAYTPGKPFTLYGTSVCRYVYDLADWDNCWWAVPLGASGHPGSPHYADQMERWADVGLYPMLYDWTWIKVDAETMQVLSPA